MSLANGGPKLGWLARKTKRRFRNEAGPQPSGPAVIHVVAPYGGRMRHTAAVESDTWATLIKRHRTARGLTQQALADLAQVSRETVWRWENGKQTPEDGMTVNLVVRALPTLDRTAALRAAGFLPSGAEQEEEDPYAWVREMGLDPSSRVVRYILSLNISDELRLASLRRERANMLRDEQRRLDDIAWTIEQRDHPTVGES